MTPVGYLNAVGAPTTPLPEPLVILVFNADLFARLSEALPGEMIGSTVRGRRPALRTRLGSVPVRVVLSGDGAPAAAMTTEILLARQARFILALGYAGSLQPDLQPGCRVVVTGAIRDEGTSGHYLPPACPAVPHPRVLQVLLSRMAGAHAGLTWTTDAPFMETEAKAHQWREAGAATVEMEVAAVFAVAQRRQGRCGALLVISDVVGPGRWHADYGRAAEGLLQCLPDLGWVAGELVEAEGSCTWEGSAC